MTTIYGKVSENGGKMDEASLGIYLSLSGPVGYLLLENTYYQSY